MELTSYYASPLSLLAPAVAITLAIVTRRVLLSLGVGILVGALLLNRFDPLQTLAFLSGSFFGVFYSDGPNINNLFILVFLLLLGVISSLIECSGGARAFGDWARSRVKSRKGTQLTTVLLGIIIFFDDYFNALAVGSISRPLADRQGVSRPKLAYLIDSTAAPVCVLTPLSSWGAYIIALIGTILFAHEVTGVSAIEAFVRMIPMNLYALFALLLVICTAALDLNFGSMLVHERRAIKQLSTSRTHSGGVLSGGRMMDLVVPILTLVVATVVSMIVSGAIVLQERGVAFSLLGAFENTMVVHSLVFGGFAGLLAAMYCMKSAGLTAATWYDSFVSGIRSMLPAIYILILAWMLVELISLLETGRYLSDLVVRSNVDIGYLPLILFVVSGAMAFSTGTSWGTFGIMLPIAGDMAASTDIAMMLPTLAAVLAGAVFGDHCSPISDTTILSSTGASCHHIDHVTTQLPYALTVALVSVIGYWVMGWTGAWMLGLLAAMLTFVVLVLSIQCYHWNVAVREFQADAE